MKISLPRLRQNQDGFDHWFLLVGLILVIGVGAVGYRVYSRSHADTPTGLTQASNDYLDLRSMSFVSSASADGSTPVTSWELSFGLTDLAKQTICSAPDGSYDYQVSTDPTNDSLWGKGSSDPDNSTSDSTALQPSCTNDWQGWANYYLTPDHLKPGSTLYVRLVQNSADGSTATPVGTTLSITVPTAVLSVTGPTSLSWHWSGTASSQSPQTASPDAKLAFSSSADMSNPQFVNSSSNITGSEGDVTNFGITDQPAGTTRYFAMFYTDVYASKTTPANPIWDLASNIVSVTLPSSSDYTYLHCSANQSSYITAGHKFAAYYTIKNTSPVTYTGNFNDVRTIVRAFNGAGQSTTLSDVVHTNLLASLSPSQYKTTTVTLTAPYKVQGSKTTKVTTTARLLNATTGRYVTSSNWGCDTVKASTSAKVYH